MKLPDITIEKILHSSSKFTDEQINAAKEKAVSTHTSLQETVLHDKLVNLVELTQLYAGYLNVPYIELDQRMLDKDVLSTLPERIAQQYSAVVFKIEDEETSKKYHIALADPGDIQAVDFLQKYIGDNFKLYISTLDNISAALDAYRDGVESEIDKVIEIQKEDDTSEQKVSQEDIAEDSPIAKTVNLLLEYAIRAEASDIHIEPRDDHVSVRYRVDGVLREANSLPKNVHAALVSRIKILASLKIDERRVPQDGRFKINLGSREYAFRVSTLPITTGEKVVLRILNESAQALTLEELGYWGEAKRDIQAAITQPHGMILVTGPTGSGKSTSLFAILSMLNSAAVNISTVEDPVEYKINGANQTQVNPQAGMTFVTGLRALLRQDPNIIMVGEIRDSETANLGIQAALTGHLVFSTLHTNNAATSLPRLLDMKIEPFLIASTVRAVVGQRLLRKLCTKCKVPYQPGSEEISSILEAFALNYDGSLQVVHELEKAAAQEALGDENMQGKLGSDGTNIAQLWKASDKGCELCGGSGYKGRMGIYEVMVSSEPLQRLVVGNATSEDIQRQSIKEGMITMQMDGLIKSLRGLTSIEEVLRVTRE